MYLPQRYKIKIHYLTFDKAQVIYHNIMPHNTSNFGNNHFHLQQR